MGEIVSLDIIKQKTEDVIRLPEASVITSDAKLWAKSNLKTVYIGDECVVKPSNGKKDIDEVVISVVGSDKVGIIATISKLLAEYNINILDINQTLIHGLFTMIMVVDIAKCDIDFSKIKKSLNDVGEKIGVKVDAQKQAIFTYMQRI